MIISVYVNNEKIEFQKNIIQTLETQSYFFTFGMGANQPFRGGLVKVIARSRKEAIEVFCEKYPDQTRGVLNCADCYSGQEFEEID